MLSTRFPGEAAFPAPAADVAEIYHEHADFVWRSLHHLGVPDADLEDLLQEVFLVVHRKLPGFDGRSRVTTWLFGICLRVAARRRRRAYFRFERRVPNVPESAHEHTPEEGAREEQNARLLERALATLRLEQRAVIVLFELEGKSCQEIAELVGVPLGTVYSRLHHARRAIKKALARGGLTSGGTP